MLSVLLKLLTLIFFAPSRIHGTNSFSRDASTTAAAVNTTTCNGLFYAYTELAGYGFISGNARDKFGDTIGGIGSAIALDQSSWTRSADGLTYTGLLWALPDRGWYVDNHQNILFFTILRIALGFGCPGHKIAASPPLDRKLRLKACEQFTP